MATGGEGRRDVRASYEGSEGFTQTRKCYHSLLNKRTGAIASILAMTPFLRYTCLASRIDETFCYIKCYFLFREFILLFDVVIIFAGHKFFTDKKFFDNLIVRWSNISFAGIF